VRIFFSANKLSPQFGMRKFNVLENFAIDDDDEEEGGKTSNIFFYFVFFVQ
jgi:hypothetical protein